MEIWFSSFEKRCDVYYSLAAGFRSTCEKWTSSCEKSIMSAECRIPPEGNPVPGSALHLVRSYVSVFRASALAVSNDEAAVLCRCGEPRVIYSSSCGAFAPASFSNRPSRHFALRSQHQPQSLAVRPCIDFLRLARASNCSRVSDRDSRSITFGVPTAKLCVRYHPIVESGAGMSSLPHRMRQRLPKDKLMRILPACSLAAASAVVGAIGFVAGPANAAVLLCYDTGSSTPQCGPTTSLVNIDKVDATFVVNGHLNNVPSQLVTFTGGELLNGDGSGQAVVSAADGSLNTWIEFALVDATFNLATFNLSPISGNSPGTPLKAESVEVTYIPTFGGAPITYTLSTNGNNIYGIYGSEGEQLQSIRFGNFAPSGGGISDLRQVRVGGVQNAVPEPGTWGLLLFGFAALGAALRRRPRRTAAEGFQTV